MTGPVRAGEGPLGFLVGEWSGEGKGSYPTIADFAYREVVTFADVGKPFLVYAQRTWRMEDGSPLHMETGYLRCPDPGRVEAVLAHPTGLTELAEGTCGPGFLRLASRSVGCTTSAKVVEAIERDVDVAGDELRYAVRMAAVGEPLTHHLAAVLHRTG